MTLTPWHSIRILPDSLLSRVLGTTESTVNSFHVQGARRPGEDVTFAAWSEGGTVEALECQDHPFCLGLQFHPEKLVGSNPAMGRIFDAFVDAAAAFQGR